MRNRNIPILSSLLLLARAETCYWANGEEAAPQLKPCGGSTYACCWNSDPANRDACFSNGYCWSWWFGRVYRGACTDKSWGEGCPRDCLDYQPKNTTVTLLSCSDDYTCCGWPDYATTCCKNGGGFRWTNATFINYDLTIPSSVKSGSAGSSSPVPNSSTSTNTVTSSLHASTGDIVGGVIGGVVFGALVVAAITFCLFRRSKRRREQEGEQPSRPKRYSERPPVQHGGGHDSQWQAVQLKPFIPQKYEMESNRNMQELDADRTIHEL